MPQLMKPTPIQYCQYCENLLTRKKYPNGRHEALFHFTKRKYCNQICMGMAFDARPSKSIDWETTHYHSRKIMKDETICEICGKENAIDVHHRDGDHTNNEKKNLQRLCRSCHNLQHRELKKCKICGIKQK